MASDYLEGFQRDTVTGALLVSSPQEGVQASLSSDVSTMPRHNAATTVALNTGIARAGRCVARTSGTYTKIRTCPGATITALSFLQLGVWDSGGIKLRETADCAASAVASTVMEIALTSAITVAEGDVLFLGGGGVFTTFSLQGSNVVAAVAAVAPVLTKSQTGYAGGPLPNLTASGIANIPWFELVP